MNDRLPETETHAIAVRELDTTEAEARLGELAAILVDAVANGASVNFLEGFSEAEGVAFWRGQLPGLQTEERILLVADDGERLLGTVVLSLAQQPNGSHRGDIGKMLVLSSARRQGLGRRLLQAAERTAVSLSRYLLLLDTETGSAGDRLYRSCGWTAIGVVPGHAFKPNGELADTTMFYKELGLES